MDILTSTIVNDDIAETADNSPKDVYQWAGLITSCARPVNNTWEFAKKQMQMIRDELDEGMVGIEERDVEKFYDACHDIMFMVGAFSYLHAHDYYNGFETMSQALLSRFDTTEEDANLTKEKYLQMGVETYNRKVETPVGLRWVTYSAVDVKISEEDVYRKDKWLKSHNYHTPDYTGDLPTLV